jgi:hypothetical protein
MMGKLIATKDCYAFGSLRKEKPDRKDIPVRFEF